MIEETRPRRGPVARLWPWLVLLLATAPAIWHFVDFPDDLDGEYPAVARPTFSPRPPSAYRLAEPGDTIDRLALYGSAVVVALSAAAWIGSRRAGFWPVSLAIGLAVGWFAATPGPCYDGWHGLGWRAIGDPSAPMGLRAGLVIAASALVAMVAMTMCRSRPGEAWRRARERGASGLLIVAAVLIALRGLDPPGVEPVGYWPRWCLAWGMMALGLALVRMFPPVTPGVVRRAILASGGVAAVALMIVVGLRIVWLHRPLERLRAVVPGKIYISAMPTRRGLEVEHARLKFRTIINLFPEETAQRSPRLPDELNFAREHGILYVASPGTAIDSDAFLDRTLALAQAPENWPILVHCHGCMDRSPAWMGIYRFVVQGRPLIDILREIEAHRGVRPKASVTLLYNYALDRLAPERFASDPTGAVLKQAAEGVHDPYHGAQARRAAIANPSEARRVPRR